MNFNKTARIGLALLPSLLLTACGDDGLSISEEGQLAFSKAANQALRLALAGDIKKPSGFYTTCSSSKTTDGGITTAIGVCDNGDFTLNITTRSSVNPRMRKKFLLLTVGDNEIKLFPKETREITGPEGNIITIKLNRTLAAFDIKGVLPHPLEMK